MLATRHFLGNLFGTFSQLIQFLLKESISATLNVNTQLISDGFCWLLVLHWLTKAVCGESLLQVHNQLWSEMSSQEFICHSHSIIYLFLWNEILIINGAGNTDWNSVFRYSGTTGSTFRYRSTEYNIGADTGTELMIPKWLFWYLWISRTDKDGKCYLFRLEIAVNCCVTRSFLFRLPSLTHCFVEYRKQRVRHAFCKTLDTSRFFKKKAGVR